MLNKQWRQASAFPLHENHVIYASPQGVANEAVRWGASRRLVMVILNVLQCDNVTKEGVAADEISSLG